MSIHCVHPVQLLCRVAHLSHIVHRSIDELVNEMIISETHENHLGTKKVIVMDDELAARVANHPEAIERLLKEFQAICAPHTQRAFFHLPLILLSYTHTPSILAIQGPNAEPTLVINLLTSLSGYNETSIIDVNGRTQRMAVWDSQDEAHKEELRRAEQKLDNFMNQVVIYATPSNNMHMSR